MISEEKYVVDDNRVLDTTAKGSIDYYVCVCTSQEAAENIADALNRQNKVSDTLRISRGISYVQKLCHEASVKAGWWQDLARGHDLRHEMRSGTTFGNALVGQKLMLIVSEVSEAMEGHRKGLQDDKLPHRKMVEVELADALIRILDLAGALELDLGGAVAEKMAYNANRPDHKIENRKADGGKAY